MSVVTTTILFYVLQGIIILHYIGIMIINIVSTYRARINPDTVTTLSEWMENHRYNMSYILLAIPLLISWALDIAYVLYMSI